jgi:hypothetical protein
LRAEGFEVLAVGNTSISIAAEPHIYQRAFQTTLKAFECPVIKEFAEQTTATFINSLDDKPFGEIDLSHTHWTPALAGIAINEPAYYFRTEETPSGLPPQTRQTYLSVPDQIAEGLNAKAVHQQGLKGDGVKVVMVDTGWYRHPFFSQNNYQGRVVLAPGSTDAEADDHGHGTGESANLFAIAPHVELTVVKADVALDGKSRNVNSIAAFKRAVDLRPDIISCSWGSDQRSHQLSPYTRALGAVVADAVRRGIIVIFSAGNGHWGFPAQHPDVIAAGGVYRHLEGPLKGQLEASSYASGFISPVYPGRVVPDVCGLVGQPPHAAYILLPVPPGSSTDRVCSLGGDGTEPTDGWAAFSGTSAAAPQIAGICALMKQIDPGLSPAQVRQILKQTARGEVAGFINLRSSGASTRADPDLATCSGLANAHAAIQSVTLTNTSLYNRFPRNRKLQFSKLSISNSPGLKEHQYLHSPQIYSTIKGQKIMNTDHPELKENLEKILWEFEEILEKYKIHDLELLINESNFLPRSLKSKTAHSLRKALNDCFPLPKRTVAKSHILAAQSLLKLKKYQETAVEILTEVITNTKYSDSKELQDLAFEALGEISDSDDMTPSETSFLGCVKNRDGTTTCTDSNGSSITYPTHC